MTSKEKFEMLREEITQLTWENTKLDELEAKAIAKLKEMFPNPGRFLETATGSYARLLRSAECAYEELERNFIKYLKENKQK